MERRNEAETHLVCFSLGAEVLGREFILQELKNREKKIKVIVQELRGQVCGMDVPSLFDFIISAQTRNELQYAYAREQFCRAVHAAKDQRFCGELAIKLTPVSEGDDFLKEIIDRLTVASFVRVVTGANEGKNIR